MLLTPGLDCDFFHKLGLPAVPFAAMPRVFIESADRVSPATMNGNRPDYFDGGSKGWQSLQDRKEPLANNEPDATSHVDAPPNAPDSAQPEVESLEPISLSLIGRLFGVPLLIIATIVGGAVAVVFLFGAPVSGERRSIDDLLTELEASSGHKSAGMLLPKEKQVWQTALELTQRLEQKEAEVGEGDLAAVTTRLARLVTTDLDHLMQVDESVQSDPDWRRLRFRRLEFVIHALGRTGHPDAVKALLDVLQSGQEPFVRVALQELGNLHELPESRRAVSFVVQVLRNSQDVETLLTGCTALSVLATKYDADAIEVLDRLRLREGGEVSWSAALALTRLGSGAGKSTMIDLLDRSFWESGDRYRTLNNAGAIVRYAMPGHRVDSLLVAAMEAAAVLDDSDLWEQIERLKSDPSAVVRGRARELLADRT